jgi:hypothetical protein
MAVNLEKVSDGSKVDSHRARRKSRREDLRRGNRASPRGLDVDHFDAIESPRESGLYERC